MYEGWIKLHRSIRKNWIWEDPLKLKWWLDILLQANHQERKILIGNEIVLIERGSFHTSTVKLSERWSVDRKTVKKFLELLQKDNMITLKTSKKGTTLKISNYKDYQAFSEPQKDKGVDNSMDKGMDNSVPTPSPDKSQISPNKVDTNKNEEELKNKNNDKEGEEGEEITPPSPPPLSIPTKYHKLILDQWSEVTYKTWFMDSEIVENGQELKIIVNSELRANAINLKYSKHLGMLLGKNIKVEIREDV